MANVRIIPRLDIKGPNLVKGIHLEGLRVLGKPWDFACKYYLDGADELIYIDAVASLYGRNNLLEIVEKTAKNIFIPLTVGGGIRSIEDIKRILRSGADKVAINTAAIHNPDFIREAAETFGSQCIVVSIQAKLINNAYIAMTDNGREASGKEVFNWAKEVVALGAGEILLTSLDNEGTGLGYDLGLVSPIAKESPIPVIACGGCGKFEHILEAIRHGHADAVSAASIFHYQYMERDIDPVDFKEEGNIEFIKRSRGSLNFMPNRIKPDSIAEVKKRLSEAGVSCRCMLQGAVNP
ncbi:MAG: imidazole glycerol phosphate synthase cyclase subunit [Candidatus Omnitrophica bacterium]|nr:imidazole glycerol phosphate synthase cyclase subunit [Candidatus Omnitrophota bacterium]